MASSLPTSKTSPPRKPLHERSDSHTNERTSPTLRLIGAPDAHIYDCSPFPSLPAHVLSPKIGSRQGIVFEDGVGVSDEDNRLSDDELEHEIQATAPLRIRKSKLIDPPRENDGPDGRPSSTQSQSPSTASMVPPTWPQTTAPDIDAVQQDSSMIYGTYGQRISDEIVQLPTVPRRGEALGSHRHTYDFTLVPAQAPIGNKTSDTSLSSVESTGTVIRTYRRSSQGISSAFPGHRRPGSVKSDGSSSISLKQISSRSDEDLSPLSPKSPISPILSSFSTPNTHFTPSIPTPTHVQHSPRSEVAIQYPVVRPPTASGSWAETTLSAPTRPPRANRSSGRWNPHLSVVHSEDPEDRSTRSVWLSNTEDIGVANSSSPNSRTEILTPPPLTFSPSRDTTGSTVRAVIEDGDDLTALPSPIPGSRNSAYYTVQSGNSIRGRRNTLQARPSSRGSLLRDGIPAWARVYYGRPSTSSRPQTSASDSTDDITHGISRPRNRRHSANIRSENRDSMAITPGGGNPVITEVQGYPRRKISQVWSPHLWHDRRSFGRRRSMFKAPSVDTEAEGCMSPRNVQRCLFAAGFIFPFAWFTASLLPLPPKPKSNGKKPERRLSRLDLARDLEKALGYVDEARYENARWWRNLNRMMSVLGVIILLAIVALAIVATQMKD